MASNPYVNKVVYGNNTVLDLTGDTVTTADVIEGKSFHGKSGASANGAMKEVSRTTEAAADTDASLELNTTDTASVYSIEDIEVSSASQSRGYLNKDRYVCAYINGLDAKPEDVVSGKSFIGYYGAKETGTMSDLQIIGIPWQTSPSSWDLGTGKISSSTYYHLSHSLDASKIVTGNSILGVRGEAVLKTLNSYDTVTVSSDYRTIEIKTGGYGTGIYLDNCNNFSIGFSISDSTSRLSMVRLGSSGALLLVGSLSTSLSHTVYKGTWELFKSEERLGYNDCIRINISSLSPKTITVSGNYLLSGDYDTSNEL